MVTINEKTTARITATLRDDAGAVVPGSSLTTATLTLYDLATDTIINSRNAQDIRNANNVTIDESGNLSWVMGAADNPIVNSALNLETHIALFQFTWGTPTKALNTEVQLQVRNLARVS